MMQAAEKVRDADFVLRIPSFEGPLDLLLYLIEKNRFTLENLEVLPIIEQYLRYMEQARNLDMALAGEFLNMASYLIWLKSCLLLPVSPEEADEDGRNPAQELKDMLMAYRAIRQASLDLSNRPMLFRDKFPKGSSQDERDISSVGIGALLNAISIIRARTRQQVMNVAYKRFNIQQIISRIEGLLRTKERLPLREAAESGSRMDIIGAFLAVLELSKRSLARIIQTSLFSEIFIARR